MEPKAPLLNFLNTLIIDIPHAFYAYVFLDMAQKTNFSHFLFG